MASFVSNVQELANTSPYVQQLPVQEMISAEQTMQQRHDVGVQQANQIFSSLSALPIAKNSVKQYSDQRINDLRNTLSKNLSGDLADSRILNQIGGYAKQISNDPIIQRGIQSTLAIQNDQKRMEEDQKKGIYNPANTDAYQTRVNSYLNSGNLQDTYSGGYVTPVDYNKQILEQIKMLNPMSTVTEQDISGLQKDENGRIVPSPALRELSQKGVTPDQINSAVGLVFSDPSVQQQISIESQYHFKGLDINQLHDNLRQNYESTVNSINEKIADEQLKTSTDKTYSPTRAAEVTQQLRKQGADITNQYQQMSQMLEQDPDAFKTSLYTNNLKSKYISTFSYNQTSSKLATNPLFSGYIQESNLALSAARLQDQRDEFNYRKQKDAQDYLLEQKKLQLKQAKLTNASGGVIPSIDQAAAVSSQEGVKDQTTFRQTQLDNATELRNVIGKNTELVARSMNIIPPMKRLSDGTYGFNVGPGAYSSVQEANSQLGKITKAIEAGDYNGTATAFVQQYKTKVTPLLQNYRAYKVLEDGIKAKMNNAFNDLKLDPSLKSDLNNNDIKTIQVTSGATQILGGGVLGSSAALTPETKNVSLTNQDILSASLYDNTSDKATKDKLGKELVEKGIGRTPQEAISILKRDPETAQLFSKFTQAIKSNPNLSTYATLRADSYRDAQQSVQTFEHNFTPKKPEEKALLQSQFMAAASKLSEIPGVKDKGTYNRFIAWAGEQKNNNFYGWKSNPDNSIDLYIRRPGEEERSIHVPEADASQLPFFQGVSSFYKTYGQMLNLTGGTTTDVQSYINPKSVTDGGLSSAMPVYGKNYTTKFHIDGNGQGGYVVRAWVFDKNGNQLVSNKQITLPNMPTFSSPEEVQTFLKGFQNDAQVQALVTYYQNQ